MSSASESCVNSEASSPYESDGEIPCSFTKRYSSSESEESVKDTSDFSDAFSQKEKADIINEITRNEDRINIYPRGVEKNIDPYILARIEAISKGKGNLVYISSGLMNMLKLPEKIPVPKCVVNDVCILLKDKPMKVLTFVANGRKFDKACAYNSHLTRMINTAMREDAVDNFHLVHGVIEEDEWISEDLFKSKIEKLEAIASIFAIPYSLDNSGSRCLEVTQSFLKMIYSYRDVAEIYEAGVFESMASNFVMTAAYHKTLDVLRHNRHATVTGGNGEGKTTIGLMLCHEYQNRGYKTFFYDSYKEADITLVSELPFLLVIDNMFDADNVLELQSFLTAFEQHIKTNDVILVLVCHLYDYKQAQKLLKSKLLADESAIDITSINRKNPGSTKRERYQMMKLLHTNLSAAELIKISNLRTVTMGFPKLAAKYHTDKDHEPIQYFSYPHKYYDGLFSKLLKESKNVMAALTLVILNGGRLEIEELRSNQCQQLNNTMAILRKIFHFYSEESIVEEIEFLSGTFLKKDSGKISFPSPVMYDSCVFVIGVSHPDILWKHGNVVFVETFNDASSVSNRNIIISKQNRMFFLQQLGNSLFKRQFRELVNNPLLLSSESVDILIEYLDNYLQSIINSVDVRGRGNLLYWSSQSGSNYLLEKLLQHSESSTICAALHCCIYSKQSSLFSYLWAKFKAQEALVCDINHQDEQGRTFLWSSVDKQDDVMVRLLLQEGSDPWIHDYFHNAPLHTACTQGNVTIVRLLLTVMGSKINMKNEKSKTPAMLAAANGHEEIFRLLATVKGCDLTCVDAHGDSALHFACTSGCTEIVRFLLTHTSVDVNARGKHGRYPLMIAASQGHGDVFELLIKRKELTIPDDWNTELELIKENKRPFGDILSYLHLRETAQHIPRQSSSRKGTNRHPIEDTLTSLIHSAARNGHIKLLEFLLSMNKDINTKGVCGRTPLMEAALGGGKEVFDLVIHKGGSLHLLDDNGCTILHMACESGSGDLVRSLLDQTKAYINTKDIFDKTPIMHAAETGQYEVFEMLVDRSDISLLDSHGNTLLHLACIGGSLAIVEHLIKTQSDVEAPNKQGMTPIMIAANHGYGDICNLLIHRRCDLDKVDYVGNTVLGLAVQSGNVQTFADILNLSRISVNNQDKNGKTLSMIAAAYGKVDVLKFLIHSRCDLTITDNNYNNILHVACCAGKKEVVETLMEENIDTNCRGLNGRTALMMAVERGYTDICDLLINKFCTLDRDDFGNNILHIACLGGYGETVKYILSQKDLDINSRGQDEKTAVMFAAQAGHKEIFDLLMMKGCDLEMLDMKENNLLHVACTGGSYDIVSYLLINASFDLNSRSNLWRTPAMFAALNGHIHVLIHLVQKECDVSLQDAEGNTIFHIACQGGCRNVCHFLMYLGIFDINVRGKCLRTPVMVAAYMGHATVFELLSEASCDLSAKDENGDCVIHMACLGGNCKIVEYLLSDVSNLDRKGRFGRTPVMLTARRGHSKVYHLLVSKKCELTVKDDLGNNLLHMACRGGNIRIVEHVLSLGMFGIDTKGQVGRTPVMIAAGKGHQEVVELLMKRGCDITQVDNDGNNILHVACLGGKSSVVKYLLGQKIVDIQQQNKFSFSAENLARYRGHGEISRLLQQI